MGRVITGVKEHKIREAKAKGSVIKSTFDTRKIRCKKCGELAVQTTDGKGGYAWKCYNCKTTFSSDPID